MTFAFKDKTDGSVTTVNVDKTPLREFQRDPKYQKLYEEAHIEVILNQCNINIIKTTLK